MRYEDQSFHPAPPPLPEGGLRPAKDDLLDRTWFAWLFWPGVVGGITAIGLVLNSVLR